MPQSSPAPSLNLLDLKPTRIASWQEREGRIVVDRPPPPRPWKAPLEWLAVLMSVKRIRLDEIGSELWRRMDGGTTVKRLCADLEKEFGERVEPVEERVGKMVHVLHREHLISLPGVDGPPGATPVPSSDGTYGT